MPRLILFYFWNTVLILSDFKKVNGIFEWGNFFMTHGFDVRLRYSIAVFPNLFCLVYPLSLFVIP